MEVLAAFNRVVREGKWEKEERDRASAASRTISLNGIVEMPVEVTGRARILLGRYSLRAGDAIQLASAQYFQQTLASPLERFLAFDERLIDAARAEGFTVR